MCHKNHHVQLQMLQALNSTRVLNLSLFLKLYLEQGFYYFLLIIVSLNQNSLLLQAHISDKPLFTSSCSDINTFKTLHHSLSYKIIVTTVMQISILLMNSPTKYHITHTSNDCHLSYLSKSL